jgi:hypothetical protein
VGVASRGKLRGLSLPILNSPPTKQPVSTGATKVQNSPVIKTASSPLRASEQIQTIKHEDIYSSGYSHGSEYGQPTYTSHFQSTRPIPIPASSSNHGWHVPGFTEHLEDYSAHSGNQARLQLRPRPLQRLHTVSSSYDDTVFSAPSTGSVSTFSESDFPSPRELPPTPEEIHLTEPFINSYPDAYPCHQEPMHQPMESYNYMNTPRSYPGTSDYASTSLGSSMGNQACMDMFPVQSAAPTSFSDFVHSTDYVPIDDMAQHFQYVKPEQEYLQQAMVSPSVHWSPVIPHTLEVSSFHHLTPRMRFLIDYYDKAICPVLVAFDSPKNPYRMHVLPLAVTSTSLQNAIAALATNNIRMRGLKELNGYGTDPFDHLSSDDIHNISNDPTPEEVHFKASSVALFNSSLKEQGGAGDDSVLATLLILCLFHVSDSGFSKFKTQLAGVQRLLSMREQQQGGSSEFLGWIQMFFTWFDVLTATVNDREAQIRPDTLDMLDLSANLGALEHLSGCEGRLFKLIARLGRLNMLSQNRPTIPTSHASTPRAAPDYYSLDGNGWGNPISPPAEIPAQTPSPDPRQEFWCEWGHIRSRLSNWVMDPPAGPQPAMTEADNALLQHISEAFRHAALLYTERLGSPHLPPSSAPIQTLVSAALRHISAIPVASCVNKFLLWPVFIVGTECVTKIDRDIIRQRCVEITRESGFWNNMSCLEVLERVWSEDDAGESWEFVKFGEEASMQAVPMMTSMGGQAFRWRKAMLRVGGEYIVV